MPDKKTIEIFEKYSVDEETKRRFLENRTCDNSWIELRCLIHAFIRDYLTKYKNELKTVMEVEADPRPPLANYRQLLSKDIKYILTNKKRYEGSLILDLNKPILAESEEYNCIICTEVLEHIEDVETAILNMRKLLKPGGLLLLTTPINFRIHGEDDYNRFLPVGMKYLLEKCGFDIEEIRCEDVINNQLPISLRVAAKKKREPTILLLGAGMKTEHVSFFMKYFRVLTTDTSQYAPTRFVCDRSFITSKFNDPKFDSEIKEIIEKENINFIIPISHFSIPYLIKNKKNIQSEVILSKKKTIETVINKIELTQHLSKNKFKTLKIFSSFKEVTKFPVILKPIYGTSSKGIDIIRSEKDVNYYSDKLEGRYIQEYVLGTEYTIDAYCNIDGTTVGIVPRIRNEICAGVSIKGKTIKSRSLIEFIKKFLGTLNFFGPICIQVMESYTNQFFIIDVNPRMGAGTSLSIAAGLNIPNYIIRNSNGENIPYHEDWKDNFVLTRYYGDIYYEE